MKSRTSSGNVTEQVQMGGGGISPNWWSIRPPPVLTSMTSFQQHHPPYNLLFHPLNSHNIFPFTPPNSITLSPQPASSSNSSSWHEPDNHHQLPSEETWSQLLLGGMDQDEEGRTQQFLMAADKLKLQNWEPSRVMLQQQQQHLLLHDLNSYDSTSLVDIKQEHHHTVPSGCYDMLGRENEDFLAAKSAWSSIVMPNSSPPKSCVTSFSNNTNNMLDFSSNKGDGIRHLHPSESNSSATGGACKKARVQQSPAQSNSFKVRKEKLGDRITALHQIVSPFGKTDTASVLLEAMGYIRFLQSQIEALSLPYLGSGSGSTRQQLQEQEDMHDKKNLRSRGLCLVPVSCTVQVGSDNGADYWAPPQAFGGGFH